LTKIGLEIHCQLTKLESKLFCSCKANYREFEPNTNICSICIGLPGSLPRLNQKAVEKATMIAMELNCSTPEKIASNAPERSPEKAKLSRSDPESAAVESEHAAAATKAHARKASPN